MREWQSQAHVKHYCRYHIVFVPKYRKKAIYGTLRKEIGGIFRELCRQGGLDLIVRLCDAGSHPHAVDHSAEVQCVAYGRISKGEVGDPDIPGVFAGEAEFHGAAFLGPGLLRQYGRVRGAGNPGVHSGPGTRRETPGADATGRALTHSPLRGLSSYHPLCGW